MEGKIMCYTTTKSGKNRAEKAIESIIKKGKDSNAYFKKYRNALIDYNVENESCMEELITINDAIRKNIRKDLNIILGITEGGKPTKNGLTLKVYLGDILMDSDIEFDFKEIVIEQ